MTDEERQRQMDFILEQQAQFTVDIQKLQESQQALLEMQAGTEQIVNRLAAATSAGFQDLSVKINALVDAQLRTDESAKDLNSKISALVDSQIRTEENLKRTDENIKNLAAIVDRHFSEGRNGKG